MTKSTGPTVQSDRIVSLDVLRGFAVLGILVMNIQDFSMIGSAYFNPNTYGDLSGLNHLVWLLSHVLADTKFLTIFSMLFGAGIVLMAQRMESRGRKPAPVHYRRMLVLLFFGLAHGWLLWSGDILYAYAMCGFLVYMFRRRKPKTLLALGIAGVAITSALGLVTQATMAYWPPESLAEMAHWWGPTEAQIAAEVEAFRGGWSEQNLFRFGITANMETTVFLTYSLWGGTGLMLLGMGLFKLGVFGAGLPDQIFRRMIGAGLFLGIPLFALGVWYQEVTGWALETGFFGGRQFNLWGGLLVALGWIGLVMLFCKRFPGSRLHRALAATGQMALTNYLVQTLVCTTIFFGHGFGLFGSVERTGQALIVLAIWAFQLVLSPWWMSRFRFGPFEWLWRSMTYLRVQPLSR
jgi:uncharacterized protein